MEPREIYQHFAAHQAALGVQVQAPRTSAIYGRIAEDPTNLTHELDVLRITETYLFLLVANQFGKALGELGDYVTQHITKSDIRNLRKVRNAWEHQDEKLSQQSFPWNDEKLGKWLTKTYGTNWINVYSTSAGQGNPLIGEVVSVVRVTSEAQAYVSYFDTGSWHRGAI